MRFENRGNGNLHFTMTNRRPGVFHHFFCRGDSVTMGRNHRKMTYKSQERVNARARQRMSAADRASEFEASTAEQASERVVKANERTFLLKSQFVYSSSPGLLSGGAYSS